MEDVACTHADLNGLQQACTYSDALVHYSQIFSRIDPAKVPIICHGLLTTLIEETTEEISNARACTRPSLLSSSPFSQLLHSLLTALFTISAT